MHTYKGERVRTDLLQDANPPEVLQFVTVAKTARARRALKDKDRRYDTAGGYYRIQTTTGEMREMEKGKLTRLGVLRNLGVY